MSPNIDISNVKLKVSSEKQKVKCSVDLNDQNTGTRDIEIVETDRNLAKLDTTDALVISVVSQLFPQSNSHTSLIQINSLNSQ